MKTNECCPQCGGYIGNPEPLRVGLQKKCESCGMKVVVSEDKDGKFWCDLALNNIMSWSG